MTYKIKILLICFLIFLIALPVRAFILQNWSSWAKDHESPSLEADISLVLDGDVNNNKEIDAGDIVRFTYTLFNSSDKKYSYAILKTNINRKQINFIHSLRGATGFSDGGETITFRNVRINPQEQRIISFDARVNYSQEDQPISTEPEFFTSDEKSIVKSSKKEITARKLSKEEIEKRLEKRGVTLKKVKSTE